MNIPSPSPRPVAPPVGAFPLPDQLTPVESKRFRALDLVLTRRASCSINEALEAAEWLVYGPDDDEDVE